MINDQGQRNNERTNQKGRDAMAPNINALVVDHEKTLEDLFRIVKIDSVPMSNMLIVLHIFRCSVVIPDRSLGRGLSIYLLFKGLFWSLSLIIQFLCGHSCLKYFFKCYFKIFNEKIYYGISHDVALLKHFNDL
jgi:hypothetical protein